MLPSLPLYSQKTIAMNDQVIEQILQERYEHVKSMIRENKEKLLRLVDYLVKNETVSGDNAIRILNGKKPIVESSDGSKEAKEISDAYFQLSLVDHYSIRDGKLVDRIPQEECVHFFDEVIEEMVGKISPENPSLYDQSLLYQLENLTLRDKAEVFDKYAGMIYNDSLKNINVREVLERVKAQNYPCLFHFTRFAYTDPSGLLRLGSALYFLTFSFQTTMIAVAFLVMFSLMVVRSEETVFVSQPVGSWVNYTEVQLNPFADNAYSVVISNRTTIFTLDTFLCESITHNGDQYICNVCVSTKDDA